MVELNNLILDRKVINKPDDTSQKVAGLNPRVFNGNFYKNMY